MSIEEYILKRQEIENINLEKRKKANKRLKELMQNPVVIEYIKEENKIKKLEKKINKYLNEFEIEYQEECDHPMFALIKDDNTNTDEIYCLVCGKKINVPLEIKFFLEKELYQQKQLIANYKGLSERTILPILESITSSEKTTKENIEVLRQNYYKQYISMKRRKELNSVIDDYTEDESFFDYFCKDGYLKYISDRKKNQKLRKN